MPRIGEWLRRLGYLLNRRRRDAALKQEMEAHRAVMDEPGRFGNVLRLREEAQDVWSLAWLDNTAREIRFATRALRRTPGFTVGAVSSVALGIALSTCGVAVTNAYLIRSLPYPSSDRLYHVMYAPSGPWEPGGISALDWGSVADVVEFPIAAAGDTLYLGDGQGAQSTRALRVTRGFVGGLGVRAVAGRSFLDVDFESGAEPVALIGESLWRDRFGGSPATVGALVRTESEAGTPETFRIVGVLPRDFYFGRDSRATVDVLVPLTAAVRAYMVRLQPNVPPSLAEKRITDAARAVATDLPADWTGVHLESAHERYVRDVRPILAGVTMAAVLVLVIVCANVAVLTVLRTLRRQREIAIRLALGSGHWQVARILGAEAILLCGAGLCAGLALAYLGLSSLAPMIEAQLGRPAPAGAAGIALDGRVLLIVALASLTVALALTLLPLLLSRRGRLAESLRQNSTTTTDGRSSRRLRSAMLAFEVALTLILLVGCGLMVQSVAAMARTDLGFEPERLIRGRIVLRAGDYASEREFAFYQQFTRRAATSLDAPVVFSSWPAFAEFPEQAVEIDGRAGHVLKAGAVNVGAGYFSTMGIVLKAGRDISEQDLSTSSPVAVISESLSRRLWPAGPAIGKSIRQVEVTAGGARPPGPWRTVVGVAADVRQTYGDRNLADIYTPWLPPGRYGSYFVRTDRTVHSVLPDLRAAAAAVDPRAVVEMPHAAEEDNRELAGTRVLTTLLGGFAAIAAFIAVIGIYAVTAYAAEQRAREVAIRLALGAAPRRIARLFLKDGGVMLGAGLVAGLAGAVAIGRLFEHEVFAVRPFDALTLLMTSLLLAAAGLLATWWPARRVSRTSPTRVLKEG